MKRVYPYLLKSFFLSLFLFPLWVFLQPYYILLVNFFSVHINLFLGKEPIVIEGLDLYSFFLVPAFALILSAKGFPVKRKLLSLLSAFLLCLLSSTFSIGFRLEDINFSSINSSYGYTGVFVLNLINTLVRTIPFLSLLFLTKGNFSLLFEEKERKENLRKCPYCGKEKTGLKDHIISVHGKKKYEEWEKKKKKIEKV